MKKLIITTLIMLVGLFVSAQVTYKLVKVDEIQTRSTDPTDTLEINARVKFTPPPLSLAQYVMTMTAAGDVVLRDSADFVGDGISGDSLWTLSGTEISAAYDVTVDDQIVATAYNDGSNSNSARVYLNFNDYGDISSQFTGNETITLTGGDCGGQVVTATNVGYMLFDGTYFDVTPNTICLNWTTATIDKSYPSDLNVSGDSYLEGNIQAGDGTMPWEFTWGTYDLIYTYGSNTMRYGDVIVTAGVLDNVEFGFYNLSTQAMFRYTSQADLKFNFAGTWGSWWDVTGLNINYYTDPVNGLRVGRDIYAIDSIVTEKALYVGRSDTVGVDYDASELGKSTTYVELNSNYNTLFEVGDSVIIKGGTCDGEVRAIASLSTSIQGGSKINFSSAVTCSNYDAVRVFNLTHEGDIYTDNITAEGEVTTGNSYAEMHTSSAGITTSSTSVWYALNAWTAGETQNASADVADSMMILNQIGVYYISYSHSFSHSTAGAEITSGIFVRNGAGGGGGWTVITGSKAVREVGNSGDKGSATMGFIYTTTAENDTIGMRVQSSTAIGGYTPLYTNLTAIRMD